MVPWVSTHEHETLPRWAQGNWNQLERLGGVIANAAKMLLVASLLASEAATCAALCLMVVWHVSMHSCLDL